MLNALRKSATGWVAKIFLGLLILSFMVWGIADIFGGYGDQSIAKVGDTEISITAFQSAYQRELSTMGDRLGRQLTTDEARALGVDRRVLGRLLTSAALANHARDLNLSVSDEYIAKKIITESSFQDAFGRFSRERYNNILNYSGLTESNYVSERHRALVRVQLNETIKGDLDVPKTLTKAFTQFHGSKRVVEYVTLPEFKIEEIQAPSEVVLRKYFSENEHQFTKPELRAITLLQIEPADLTKNIEVLEEDIEVEYAARRDQYETPEQRSIDQILFNSADEAEAAYTKIKLGANFIQIALEAGYSASDIDLGVVEKSDIIDQQIAKAAFSLGEGKISEPVMGALGVALVRVKSIIPSTVRSFASAHNEIRERLALELAEDEVLNLFDSVEDARAGNSSLHEIAAQLDLTKIRINAIDRLGRDANNDAVAVFPMSPQFLRDVFESDIGVENNASETNSGGFVWFDVTGITAPELKTFESVHKEVMKSWQEKEITTYQINKANLLVEDGSSGITIKDIAEELSTISAISDPFTRRTPTTPFAPSLVEAAFSVPVGTFLTGPGRNEGERIVLVLRKIQVADALSESEIDMLEKDARFIISNDLYGQYVSGLQAREGVTINEAALSALFGNAS